MSRRITLSVSVPDRDGVEADPEQAKAFLRELITEGPTGVAGFTVTRITVDTCRICGRDSDLAAGRAVCADRDACRDRYRDAQHAEWAAEDAAR